MQENKLDIIKNMLNNKYRNTHRVQITIFGNRCFSVARWSILTPQT